MPLSRAQSFNQQTTSSTTNTSASIATAINDIVVVSYVAEDNSSAGSLSIANTGTALSWNLIAQTNTSTNTKCSAWWANVATAGNITVTVTSGGTIRSSLCVDVYTGAHQTTPVPPGNVFSGVNATDPSQSLTPTATGSMLRMLVGDWNASNTFAAIANCTLNNTFHDAAAMTAVFLSPTTQPLGAGAFTIGVTDTGAQDAWIAFEVQAAPGLSAGNAKYRIRTAKRGGRRAYEFSQGFDPAFNVQGAFDKDLALFATGGPTSHATTGVLSAGGAVVTGTSAHIANHQTNGALLAGGALMSGTASRFRAHSASGQLLADSAIITGAARHNIPHASTGALLADSAIVTGSANRTTGFVSHATTGSLVVDGAIVSGSASHFTVHSTAAVLLADGALITGLASRTRSHATTGALLGDVSLLTGSALNFTVHAATGAMIADGGIITGLTQRSGSAITHATTGTLAGGGALVTGLANLLAQVGGHTGGDDAPGGIYWQGQPKREITRKAIDRLLDKSVKEFFEETVKDKKLAKKARKIVKPYQLEQEIDWISLSQDLSRVQLLLDLYIEYLFSLDEEEILILLLTMV
jgi:hypothetical protein